MNLQTLLEQVKTGDISLEQAEKQIKSLAFEDIGYAKIDHHRELRQGLPEVVYGAGKTAEQIDGILQHILKVASTHVMVTRISSDKFDALSVKDKLTYYPEAQIAVCWQGERHERGDIAICAAGTSDLFVCEEAALTAMCMGNKVSRYYDIGVAGIHRLFAKLEEIKQANVIIAVAGMEGALPGVLAGLVEVPVIAVPTSVGYGANFGGLSALLTMLNSCANGISVVNIDNGFGAGYLAGQINKLATGELVR